MTNYKSTRRTQIHARMRRSTPRCLRVDTARMAGEPASTPLNHCLMSTSSGSPVFAKLMTLPMPGRTDQCTSHRAMAGRWQTADSRQQAVGRRRLTLRVGRVGDSLDPNPAAVAKLCTLCIRCCGLRFTNVECPRHPVAGMQSLAGRVQYGELPASLRVSERGADCEERVACAPALLWPA